jgi:hypothetical protein
MLFELVLAICTSILFWDEGFSDCLLRLGSVADAMYSDMGWLNSWGAWRTL